MSIANITFETLLAYVVPAAILESLFVPLIANRIMWDSQVGLYFIIGFLGISVILGLLLDMWSVTVSTRLIRWQQNRRGEILFGKPDKRNTLFKYLETLYPNTSEKDKTSFIYAVFNNHVTEHIYSRRNYDWYFFQASRNTLTSFPFCLIALILLGNKYSWSLSIILAVGLVVIILILTIYIFMQSQLEIYYGYYVNVTLGYLLEHSDQYTKQVSLINNTTAINKGTKKKVA
jgi:hypothetical protein